MPKTKMDELAKRLNDEDGFIPEDSVEDNSKKKKVFTQTDLIMCRSVTTGGLYMEGAKTKQLYQWSDYGDESEVEYRDLVAEIRSRSSYIFTPRFIIEDEDFVNENPQLKQFYSQYLGVKELREILNLPVAAMAKKIVELPAGAKDSLRNIASSMIASGAIDSVAKIKKLDELFDTDMEFLSSLLN